MKVVIIIDHEIKSGQFIIIGKMQSLQKQLDYAFELVSKPDNKQIKQG